MQGVVTAQIIHAVVFATTKDATIGEGVVIAHNKLNAEFEKIAAHTGMQLKKHYYTSQQCSKTNAKSILQILLPEIADNDVVVFVFLGHGYENHDILNNFPNVIFKNLQGNQLKQADLAQVSWNLEDIHRQIKKTNARLVITIAEACNSELDTELQVIPLSDAVNQTQYKAMNPFVEKIDTALRYKELFLYAKGEILLTSSLKRQGSYVGENGSGLGGLFSDNLIDAIHSETEIPIRADWLKVLEYTRSNTQLDAQNLKPSKEQVPIWEYKINYQIPDPKIIVSKEKAGFWVKLTGLVFPTRVQKEVVRAFKDDKGTFREGLQVLTDMSEKEEERVKKRTPLSYYLALGLWNEELNPLDTANAYLNYGVAYMLSQQGITKQDRNTIDRIKKLDGKRDDNKQVGINKETDYERWLYLKLQDYRSIFNKKIDTINIDVDSLYKEQDKIIEVIDSLENAREKALKKIKKLNDQVNGIDRGRIESINVKLNRAKSVNKNTRQKIDQLLQDIDQGLVDKVDTFYVDDVMVTFSIAKRNAISNIMLDKGNVELNQHCTNDIVETTNNVIAPLLQPIVDIPEKERTDIEIKIVLKGHADWQGASNAIKMRALPYDIPLKNYFDKQGINHTFKYNANEVKTITNLELAFLRAYCAYTHILEVFKQKDISTKNTTFVFYAIEHQENEADLSKPKEERGAEFRGVDIDLQHNAFKHYTQKIAELEEEMELIEKQRKRDKKQITRLKMYAVDVYEEIRIKNEKKKDLEEVIKTVDKSPNSEAQKLVDEVLKIQNGN